MVIDLFEQEVHFLLVEDIAVIDQEINGDYLHFLVAAQRIGEFQAPSFDLLPLVRATLHQVSQNGDLLVLVAEHVGALLERLVVVHVAAGAFLVDALICLVELQVVPELRVDLEVPFV